MYRSMKNDVVTRGIYASHVSLVILLRTLIKPRVCKNLTRDHESQMHDFRNPRILVG